MAQLSREWQLTLDAMSPEQKNELLRAIDERNLPDDAPLPPPSEFGFEVPSAEPAAPEPAPLSDRIESGPLMPFRTLADSTGRERVKENLVSSLGKRFGEFKDLAKGTVEPLWEMPQGKPRTMAPSPPDMVKFKEAATQWPPTLMARLGKGFSDVQKGDLLSPNAEMFTGAVRQAHEEMTDPDAFAEDPTAALFNYLDVLSLALGGAGKAAGAGRVGGILKKAARATDLAADLPMTTIRGGVKAGVGAARGAIKAADKAPSIYAPIAGVMTGRGADVIKSHYTAGRGGRRQALIHEGTGKRTLSEYAQDKLRTATGQPEKFGRLSAGQQPPPRVPPDQGQPISPTSAELSDVRGRQLADMPLERQGRDVTDFADQVIDRGNELDQQYGKYIEPTRQWMRETGQLVDVTRAQQDILNMMEQDFGIEFVQQPSGRLSIDLPSDIVDDVNQRVKQAIEETVNMDPITRASGVDAQVQRLGSLPKGGRTGALIGRIRQTLNEQISHLGPSAERAAQYGLPEDMTFGEAKRPFAEHKRWQTENIEEKLGTPVSGTGLDRPSKTQLGGRMSSGVLKGDEEIMNALRALEEETGMPVVEPVSAHLSRKWTPTGLAGHMGMLAAATGIGGGAAAGALALVNPLTLAVSLPILAISYSPRGVMRALSFAGASTREAAKIVDFGDNLIRQAERSNIPVTKYTTMGELMERTLQEPEEQGQAGPGSQLPRIGEGAQARELPTIGEGAQSRLLPLIGQSR